MFNSTGHLEGAKLSASDGDIGTLVDTYFDDQAWAIRHLVVDTGNWLYGRSVLISPYAVQQPVAGDTSIRLALTRQQIKDSPDVDTRQPVSRQQELALARHYAYPAYWDGGGLWALDAMPDAALTATAPTGRAANHAMLAGDLLGDDVHLRSSGHVTGYDVQASDDSIGPVQDFVFDVRSWAIRYLVVDTQRWWPGGQRVLVGTHWVDRIDWASRQLHMRLTLAQVRASPGFQDVASISRDDEIRLHRNYERPGYWD